MPIAQAQRWLIERVEHRVLPLSLCCDEGGALTGVSLHDDPAALRARAKTLGVERVEEREGAPSEAQRQLVAFLGGELRRFDLRLDLHGTTFEKEVWEAVARVEWGETRSYGELAKQLGRPGASRAVGRANGANPVPLVVPCHRVIGADGSLTGFAGGIEAKRWLLEREAAQTGLFAPEVATRG